MILNPVTFGDDVYTSAIAGMVCNEYNKSALAAVQLKYFRD